MTQPHNLLELCKELQQGAFQISGNAQQPILGISWDYQQIKPGFLYFCIENEEFQESHIQTNSLGHLQDALDKGATAIVAGRGKIQQLPAGVSLVEVDEVNQALALITKAFYGNPYENIRLYGITGTNGKTTTSQILDAIFQTANLRTGVIGTIGTFYPSGKQSPSHLSNPMATELFPIGKKMQAEEVEHLIMEVTSHAMAFERNHALDFDIAIFTNLSQDHLDFHKTFKEYKNAKLKHFAALGKGNKKAYAVVNLDDEHGMDCIEAIDLRTRQSNKVEIITYGIRNPKADLVAIPLEVTGSGTKLKIEFRGEELAEFFLPMAGQFNISNALAAFGAAFASGINIETIQKGLEDSRQIEGRFEKLNIGQNFQCFVDYAHTPDSLEKISTEVKRITQNRLIVVFGCGGDRDRAKRPMMGTIAAEIADIVVVTSDNPRTEDPEQIIQDISDAFSEEQIGKVYREADRKAAIHLALNMAESGDSVLIAGKGHETYQQIGQVKHPFSDREVATSYFQSGQSPYNRARLEVNLAQVKRNFQLIFQEKPEDLKILHVVKDDALGHGMLQSAQIAMDTGCHYLGVACMAEAIQLRQGGIQEAPILVFGERCNEELDQAIRFNLTLQLQSLDTAEQLNKIAGQQKTTAKVHLKVDTGMGRYGVHWERAFALFQQIHALPNLEIEGLMTHFAQSDEEKKDYALLQLQRFQQVVTDLENANLRPALVHACNSGGYLDLPEAHFDMVRIGILPTGVYPSKVCRRIKLNGKELQPAMQAKAKVAFRKRLQAGESLGYGMHYTASKPTEVAVLPIGYGDGYPRVRNVGHVLIQGVECPIIGGNAMDAMMVDVSHLAQIQKGEEVVLLGRQIGQQGEKEITAMMLQDWAKTVTYAIMTLWTKRLERIFLEI